MSTKKNRVGEVAKNNQGLVMRIVKYRNNKDILVEFPQTTQLKRTSYMSFKRGKVAADLVNYPFNGDCSFKQAKFFTVALLAVLISAITVITLLIVR